MAKAVGIDLGTTNSVVASQMIASAACRQTAGTGSGDRESEAGEYRQGGYRPSPGGGDDVIDAEFTEH